jgi:hypothetical protein
MISDKVNIWPEIEAEGAALVIPDTVEGVRKGLATWLRYRPEEQAAFRERARRCFALRYERRAAGDHLLRLLQNPHDPCSERSTPTPAPAPASH